MIPPTLPATESSTVRLAHRLPSATREGSTPGNSVEVVPDHRLRRSLGTTMATCMSSCLLGRGLVGQWQERRQSQRHWTRTTAFRPSYSLRRPVCASASPSAEEEIIAALPPVPYSRHAWNWKGHNISWAVRSRTSGSGERGQTKKN